MNKAIVFLILFANTLIGFSQTQPKPVLKWGGRVFADGHIFNNDSFISLGFHDESQIQLAYQIIHWELTLNEMTYSGKGNILSDKVMKIIKKEAGKKASFSIGLKVNFKDQNDEIASLQQESTVHSWICLSNTDEYQKLWSDSKIIVIEKSKKTSKIFDESIPFSLVSLMRQNYIQDAYPMSLSTSERLMALGQKLVKGFFIQYSLHPITESDSLNPNYGNEKINENGEFLYSPPQEYLYDLIEIDRIIIFLKDTDISKPDLSSQSISHVAFCKKYAGDKRHEIVLSYPFHSNVMDNGIIAFEESLDENIQHFIDLQNKLASRNKVNYQVGGLSLFESSRIINFEEPYFSQLNRDELYSFEKFSGEAIAFMPALHYQAIPEVYSSFGSAFDSIHYDRIIYDVPLVNQYGEDSLIYDKDGSESYVYPIEYRINKILLNTNFSTQQEIPLKVVLKYELQLNSENTPLFKPTEAIYCVKNDSGWMVFASIDLADALTENASFLDARNMEWLTDMEIALKKGKTIDLKNNKESKKLKKLYNIDF